MIPFLSFTLKVFLFVKDIKHASPFSIDLGSNAF
jgi:hypothetical protein